MVGKKSLAGTFLSTPRRFVHDSEYLPCETPRSFDRCLWLSYLALMMGGDSRWATTVEDVGNALEVLAGILERWDIRLRRLVDQLPDPRYAEGSDEPLNLEAQIQGRISAALDDELQPLVETLRELASRVEEPDG